MVTNLVRCHGVSHFSQNAARPDEVQKAAVLLACFLHDADDHKYFSNKGLVNAKRILNEAISLEKEMLSPEQGAELLELILTMIDLVSASSNSNTVPVAAESQPWLLWPRWCDRLESIGVVGVVRCWQYTIEKGQALHRPGLSPQPRTEEELWQMVHDEQFTAYQERGGVSFSMIDHYYDKLLHLPGGLLKRPELPRAPYLIEEAQKRVAPLIDVCLAYGRSGGVFPHQLLEEMSTRLVETRPHSTNA